MTGLVTRRALLAGAAGLTAAASGATWSLAPGVPDDGLLVLTRAERRVVEALADAFFPGVHLPLTGTQAGVPAEVDRIVAEVMDPLHGAGFRYILRALEYGTAASRGRRFTELDRAEQLDVLETWSEPDVVPRRVAGESLKAVFGMAYFAHPEVQRALGWRTGCQGGAA